jgi:Cu/Zn superoxide dismutase
MEGDRPDSILNRAVVIHAKKDDKKGNGGAALACGVITLVEP